ncbi:MAG: HAD hydrolase-like protein [Planctomycetes bacterium]|nr:HAD hydrolase-like protein [Planctomycetota bacterium]
MYALRALAQASDAPGRRGEIHQPDQYTALTAPAVIDSPPAAALLFDPENVFYDATLWKRWLSQLLTRMGLHAPFPDFFTRWEEECREEVDLGRRDYWDALREYLAQEGLSPGMIAEVFAAGVRRKHRFESDVRPLAGVAETLMRLSARGFALAVVSNTPRRSEHVLRELDGMGLRNLFMASVTSLDIGEAMPQAGCYRAALERMGLDAAEVVFIASQPRSLEGAARLGVRTIAFNSYPAAPPSAASLEQFPELCRIVHPARRIQRAG